ncbi:MAG: hypothetical protein KAS32_30450 [Candidatus Peribacteraceae bacterium]|nr:hypothetical protein [Candidatus Peribacteraceae bacterium]
MSLNTVKTRIDFAAIFADGGKTNPETMKNLCLDVNDFFDEVMSGKAFQANKSTPADSNLMGENPVIDVIAETPFLDRGYEEIFEEVDLTDSTSDTYELIDVANSIVFEELKNGEPIKPRRVKKSSKATYSFLEYGAGITIKDDWVRFNKYYAIEELLRNVPLKALELKATTHYALIAALGAGIDVAAVTNDNAATIDKCIATILNNCKDKGYGVGDETPFVVVCNPTDKRKMSLAVWPTKFNVNSTVNPPTFNVKKIVTTYKLAAGTAYVVLPGRKSKTPLWERLNSGTDRSNMNRSDDIGYLMKFNAIIGDSDQFARFTVQ